LFATQKDDKGFTDKLGDIKDTVVEKALDAKEYIKDKAHEVKEAFTLKTSDTEAFS